VYQILEVGDENRDLTNYGQKIGKNGVQLAVYQTIGRGQWATALGRPPNDRRPLVAQLLVAGSQVTYSR
jgi:hypothetical protein